MKTTLVLDDFIFRSAQKIARQNHETISQVISRWSRVGWESLKLQTKTSRKRTFKPVNLGISSVDLSNRQLWMDQLDDRA